MKIGLAKVDITPRVGVELCGFGPYLNRRSTGVRDRLWARAMAIRQGDKTLVLVSNDLIGVSPDITTAVRRLVRDATGIEEDAVMVHCIHTHSGPLTDRMLFGWAVLDEPYVAILPYRIAGACIQAVANLTEATLGHAKVPCEGIALNREYDVDAPPLDEVLRDDWRPAKPELTDTTCHVLTVKAQGKLIGFASYFGCHPVVCCQETHQIHGDYAGVATNMLEREYPGAVGLFLQGAQGDVNTCVVHKPDLESMLALDIIAARYANAVRAGLAQAQPLPVDALKSVRRPCCPSRIDLNEAGLRSWLAENEAIIAAADASDSSHNVRMATVYLLALRRVLEKVRRGESVAEPTELQAFGIGPLVLFGTPFEIFQAVKNEFIGASRVPIPLLLGITNDGQGYVPDHVAAARGGYASQVVPLMKGSLPFADAHGELVQALREMEEALLTSPVSASR